jgi:hypothetical protein
VQRRLYPIALALAAALLAPGATPTAAANAPLAIAAGDAATLYQGWLDSSALPVPVDPISVTLRNCRPNIQACMENGGITFPDIAYLADTAVYGPAEVERQRALFMHEVGHVLDQRLAGRGGYRREFRRILGRRKVVAMRGYWWSAGFIPDSETFADAYAMCATSPHTMPRDHVYTGYGTYRPSDRQHARICHMLGGRLTAG